MRRCVILRGIYIIHVSINVGRYDHVDLHSFCSNLHYIAVRISKYRSRFSINVMKFIVYESRNRHNIGV